MTGLLLVALFVANNPANVFAIFHKRFGHNIDTCYHCNKLVVSISTATVANTESVQPMAPVSAQSKSSGHTFIMSTDDLKPAPHPLNIHTANGSTMSSHTIGSISTFNLSVPRVFNVPDLSYNLFSVGQLAELGYRIIFDYSGCIVQDPRMG